MTSNTGRDLRYAQENYHKYRQLIEDDLSPFYGAKFKYIFLYAAAYGFGNGMRQPLIKGQANIPLSALSEEEHWLLKSIAIADSKSLAILKNEKDMYQIAEEYANGALKAIYLEVFGGKPEEPYRRMILDVYAEFEMIGMFVGDAPGKAVSYRHRGTLLMSDKKSCDVFNTSQFFLNVGSQKCALPLTLPTPDGQYQPPVPALPTGHLQ